MVVVEACMGLASTTASMQFITRWVQSPLSCLSAWPNFKIFRPCLVGRKFSVFCIQTFRKQGKRV